ncbi:MAG: hypothetical protein H0T79_12960 [Deltaproteobacteria bacterium]|nr:hypothetical protein [Deltaproteobacteria bacterium]
MPSRRRLVIVALCTAGLVVAWKARRDPTPASTIGRDLRVNALIRDHHRAQLDALALDAYPRWVLANPTRLCPETLEELMPYAPATARVTDPWEHRYHFGCNGPDPDIAQLWVQSAGPDTTFGTGDDLWSARR